MVLQVEDQLKDQKQGIVGMYVGDVHLAKEDFDNGSKTIGNKIASLNTAPSTVALIVCFTCREHLQAYSFR